MIKWAGFGKLLKQSLFILLISCFIGLGGLFVSADDLQYQVFVVGDTPSQSLFNTQYSFTAVPRGRFLSQYLGYGRNIMALNHSYLNFWTKDGNGNIGLYVFDGNRMQGFYQYFYSCDDLGGPATGDWLQNCDSPVHFNLGDSVIANFINNVKRGDYVYVGQSHYYDLSCSNYCRYNIYNNRVCFSSSEIGKSLCFVGQVRGYYYDQNPNPIGASIGLPSDTTFSNIDEDYLQFPPNYTAGENINGGSQDVNGSTIDGNLMYSTCSKKRALTWYQNNGYNNKMCYSSYLNNTDIYNGAGSVGAFAFTGMDISEVRMDTATYRRGGATGAGMGYDTWFQYWRKTYEVYKSNSNLNNPFVGVPVSVFTLMGNVDAYALPYDNSSILDFCDLSIFTADYTATYDGVNASQICAMSPIDFVADSVGVHAESGQIVQGSSWVGITNRPGYYELPVGNGGNSTTGGVVGGTPVSGDGLSFFGDGKTFENSYFNLLQNSFKYPDRTSKGVLPSYIIVTLCALCLFRFLRH